MTPEQTYETSGPKCPYCQYQYRADEAGFYDEQNYTEETCDNCGEMFDVEVYHSVSWTCSPKEPSDER